MGLSRNKVAVSEGAAGSPPFYGERVLLTNVEHYEVLRKTKDDGETLVGNPIVVQYSVTEVTEKKVSATNAEGPPVPIPNTEVKLCSGENTLRETVREDSSVLTRSWSGEIHSND